MACKTKSSTEQVLSPLRKGSLPDNSIMPLTSADEEYFGAALLRGPAIFDLGFGFCVVRPGGSQADVKARRSV